MYKQDLALNNLKWLICHKTRPNNQQQKKSNSEVKISHIVKCNIACSTVAYV